MQVSRPTLVSMTAVGPVGVTGALAWLVVLGASGSASDGGGGGVDCAGWDCVAGGRVDAG